MVFRLEKKEYKFTCIGKLNLKTWATIFHDDVTLLN